MDEHPLVTQLREALRAEDNGGPVDDTDVAIQKINAALPDEAEFNLTIQMGNDAMNHYTDIAPVLREIADGLEDFEARPMRDANGNTIGEWTYDHDGVRMRS